MYVYRYIDSPCWQFMAWHQTSPSLMVTHHHLCWLKLFRKKSHWSLIQVPKIWCWTPSNIPWLPWHQWYLHGMLWFHTPSAGWIPHSQQFLQGESPWFIHFCWADMGLRPILTYSYNLLGSGDVFIIEHFQLSEEGFRPGPCDQRLLHLAQLCTWGQGETNILWFSSSCPQFLTMFGKSGQKKRFSPKIWGCLLQNIRHLEILRFEHQPSRMILMASPAVSRWYAHGRASSDTAVATWRNTLSWWCCWWKNLQRCRTRPGTPVTNGWWRISGMMGCMMGIKVVQTLKTRGTGRSNS